MGKRHDIMEKGVYLTLCLACKNLANSNPVKESNGRCPGCDYIMPLILVYVLIVSFWMHVFGVHGLIGKVFHIGVGSDVVHSTGLGNARAFTSGMDNR